MSHSVSHESSAGVVAAATATPVRSGSATRAANEAIASATLANRTAHGFAWLLAQTIGSKLVGIVGQSVLAWLLMPADLGVWAMVMVVMGFTGLIQQAGIRETLIHRHRTFHLWANSAFWMTVALGCVAAVVTAALAWPVAWLFHEPRLFGLLLVVALTAPLQSLDLVAETKLQIQSRFGLIAGSKWVMTVSQLALQVLFAALGFGAYSFVLPLPIIAVARLVWLWTAARPPVRWGGWQTGRWRFLVNNSAIVFVSNLFMQIQWQGDYIVLGLLFAKPIVGLYFFAFNLSTHTMQLFTGSLAGVLFPALSKLQGDPRRQLKAFLDATQLLAMVAVPLCVLQVAAADPGVRLVFQDHKWEAAIPVLQALSIGMAFRVVASPGGSLIQAQGRFRVILLTNILNVAFFIPLVLVAALVSDPVSPNWWWHPATTVGISVAVYFAIIGPIFLYVAIRPAEGTVRDLWRVYAAPMACSIVAGAAAMYLATWVPADKVRGHRWAQGVRLTTVVVWFVVIYVPLIRLTAPDAWRALVGRIVALYRGRRNGGAGFPVVPPSTATASVPTAAPARS